MGQIRKIEPAVPILTKRKRVAAYARVSKETERLTHSISAQISYYSKLIQGNPEWEYAGVYADTGITGTATQKRDEFRRLIADCEAGKIDKTIVRLIQKHDNESAVKPPFLGGFPHFWGFGCMIKAYSKAQAARFFHDTL